MRKLRKPASQQEGYGAEENLAEDEQEFRSSAFVTNMFQLCFFSNGNYIFNFLTQQVYASYCSLVIQNVI